MRTIQVDRESLRRYGHSKLSKMAAAAILNLFESKIAPIDIMNINDVYDSAIRSAVPENPAP